ncbi:MAG: DUF308 domain-containing protein [Roseburia sp.]|nr:DUF308 domain-containing protein [Roseburia sp.]
MMDTIKRIKADMILSALVCVALGVVLLIWPAETIDIFCKVLAAGLIVIGVVNIFSYFINKDLHPFGAVLGPIVVLVGVWIFVRPESIVSLVPIVIGVMLCVHGIQDMKLSFETKANGYEKWWSMLLIALISLVFGVLCIVNAFGIVTLALQFIGVALIYDGMTDIWVASRAIRVARAKRKEEEALESPYREVESEPETEKDN